MTDDDVRDAILAGAPRFGLRRSDVAQCALAASHLIDAVHVEVVSPGRVAVEPFAFYDEPLRLEAMADVEGFLREHMPAWLLVEVRPAWRHVPRP